jgi:hypothetical protein
MAQKPRRRWRRMFDATQARGGPLGAPMVVVLIASMVMAIVAMAIFLGVDWRTVR